ncbi:hypothetical protein K504DRAFT_375470 [Pleomassaria siparia CBS 279.74]|uniref:Uncharacterized protein n=1 Tax=Pleomassaria siparia CBS 279.74 TaxID=1314801 RepID=A0A6G1KE31_9PLEO|nr:hypothetical protein K504DRAFT_375470 [Pleomassaria siparia CBS 279.74]
MKLDPLRFGIWTGEISFADLLMLPYFKRREIVEKPPFIEIYLGATRVHKRVSKTLLLAFCPDIGRFIQCSDSRFLVRLSYAFNHMLSVKLAVQYMESYALHTRFRTAEWKVRGEAIADYIAVAEVFWYMGANEAAEKLEQAIIRRLKEHPLNIDQVRNIWAQENTEWPSRWAHRMADNIVTWSSVPKMEAWMASCNTEAEAAFQSVISKRMQDMAETYDKSRSALFKARQSTSFLERFLEEFNSIALKQLVWTADPFLKPTPEDPDEFILIATIPILVPSVKNLARMKRIELRKKSEQPTKDELVC